MVGINTFCEAAPYFSPAMSPNVRNSPEYVPNPCTPLSASDSISILSILSWFIISSIVLIIFSLCLSNLSGITCLLR